MTPLAGLGPRRAARVAVAAAAAFVLLCALGAAGLHTGLDQYAVTHWMPGMDHGAGSRGDDVLDLGRFSEALLPGWKAPRSGSEAASLLTYIWVLAASGLPSALVCGAAWWWLWRRGRRALALLLAAGFIGGNLVEVVTKVELQRAVLATWVPPGTLPRILPYDHSFPSGHSLRSWLMAGSLLLGPAAAWPRAARWALALWAAAVLPLLVTGAWHTPFDVAGGAVLALLCLAAAVALERPLARRLR